MGTGTLEVQIFVSLAVILGTALIALIVDYLKGNNENLREHNIELRVRQQERDKSALPGSGRRRVRVVVAEKQQSRQEETPAVVAVVTQSESTVEQEVVAIPVSIAESVAVAAEAESIPVFVENAAEPVEAETSQTMGDLLTQVIAVTPALAQRMEAPSEVVAALPEPAPVAEEPAALMVTEVVEAAPELQLASVVEPAVEVVAEAAVELVPEPVVEGVPELVLVEEAQVALPEPSNIIYIKPVGEPVEGPARFRSMEFNEFFAAPVAEAVSSPDEVAEIPAVLPEPEVVAEVAADPFVFKPIEERTVEPVAEQAPLEVEPEYPSAFTYELPVASRPVMFGSSSQTVLPNLPPIAIENELPADHWSLSEVVEPASDTLETPEPAVSAITVEETVQEPVQEVILDILESEVPAQPEPSKPRLVAAIEPSICALEIPIGLQSSDVLEALVATPGVLSGVVVAIGINDYQQLQSSHSKAAFDDLMRSVTNLVESIAANKGMAVRRSEDEYILIFPQDSGSMGQRRLTQISERLWDFQLRSLGSFSILFSWGAVEVAMEQLSDAIDAANEQMYQTKRTRSGSFNSPGSRKRAVNL